MKYFKPELLARCQSLDDDVADAAREEWELAFRAYRTRIDAIRKGFPVSVRRFMSTVSLHDAKLLGLSIATQKPHVAIRVRLEGSKDHPGQILDLNYRPVVRPMQGVNIQRRRNIGSDAAGALWVLYNEWDADKKRGHFTHRLLLTALEIEVQFLSFSVRRLDEVISPRELASQESVARVPSWFSVVDLPLSCGK